MAKRKPKPLTPEKLPAPVIDVPIVVDTKAIEMGKIQQRLTELQKARAKAQAKLPRFDSGIRDETLTTVLKQALKVIETERLHLMARQFHLENNVDLYVEKSAAPAAPKVKAEWEIKGLSKPEYPKGARLAGNDDLLDERRQAFDHYYFDMLAKSASEDGFSPDDEIDLESLLIVRAESLAALFWEAHRFMELEDRVQIIESVAETRYNYSEQRLTDIAAIEAKKSNQLEARLSDLEAHPLGPQVADLERRVSDVAMLWADARAAIEQASDQRFRDLEQRLIDVAALQGSTLGGLQQRLTDVETKADEVEKFREIDHRVGDLELKSRVVKTVTNVVGWDAAGRVTRTEKLEGQGEFIDAVGKLAELEQRLIDVLEGSLVEVLEDDGRFVLRRWMKDGRILREARSQTKMPIYRGVHDHSRTYLPGDMVSRGGSLWHCDVECSGPFNGDRFTLAVKKGRDGAHHD